LRELGDYQGNASLHETHAAEARLASSDPDDLAWAIIRHAYVLTWLPDREEETLGLLREAHALSAAGPETYGSARLESIRQLALHLQYFGRHEESVKLAREACAILRRAGPRRERQMSGVLHTMALSLRDGGGNLAEAEDAMRESVEVLERRRHTPSSLGLRLFDLATILWLRGDVEAAEAIESRAAETYRTSDRYRLWSLGTAVRIDGAATLLRRFGRLDSSERLLRDCLTLRRELAPDHWLTVDTQSRLADLLVDQAVAADNHDRSAACLREAEALLLECMAAWPAGATQATWLPVLERFARLYEVRRSIGL